MKTFVALIAALAIAFALILVAAPAKATYQSGTAITACDQYGGGVKLFASEGQTGPDRVFCAEPDGVSVDNNFDTYTYNSLFDVGLFSDNINSLRIRTPAGCYAHLWLYPGLGRTGQPVLYQVNNLQGDSPKVRDLDTPDNVYSSGDISTDCQ